MELLHCTRKTRRKPWRKPLVFVLVVAAAFGAWTAKDPALLQYRLWKQDRALAQAKEFIQKRDAPRAQVALEVALNAVPGNYAAWRVAADIMDQVGAAQAVKLRRRIVQAVPDSASDRASLVMSALRFRDLNTAREALSEMTPEQADEPPSLHAALAFAIETDNAAVADALFDRIKPLFPLNDDIKVAHGMLRLRHPSAEKAAVAKKDLEGIAANPKHSLQIHREFMALALAKKDYAEGRRWLEKIEQNPESNFSDRLQRANLELLVEKKPFQDVFARLANNVPATGPEIALFTRWLLVQGKAAEAARWIDARPAALQNDPDVLHVRADVFAEMKQWDKLSNLLESGAWGPTTKDTIKLAMSVQVIGSRGNAGLKRQMWDEALQSAGPSLSSLRILQRLAALWQWDDESERTLWAIAKAFPDQTWAYQALFDFSRQQKKAVAMRDIMAALRAADPTVLRYQSDWAMLSLLTEPTPSWNTPKEMLRKLYSQSPKNAFFATGYAFALAQIGRNDEALALVEKLPESDREYPPRAPYLCFIYGVNHRREKFAKYEPLGKNVDLLNEERRLLVAGREALR
jgi:tetratricopeptide (TPR) repeat protein